MWSRNTRERLGIVRHILEDAYTKKWQVDKWLDYVPAARAWRDFLMSEHKDVLAAKVPHDEYGYERWLLDEAWDGVQARDFWPQFTAKLAEEDKRERELLYVQVRLLAEYFGGIDQITGESTRWGNKPAPVVQRPTDKGDWNHEIVFQRNRFLATIKKKEVEEKQKDVDVLVNDTDVWADKFGHKPGDTWQETVEKIYKGEKTSYVVAGAGVLVILLILGRL